MFVVMLAQCLQSITQDTKSNKYEPEQEVVNRHSISSEYLASAVYVLITWHRLTGQNST